MTPARPQAGVSAEALPSLAASLRRIDAAARRTQGLAALMLSLAVGLALLLMVISVDAMVGLSPTGLLVVDGVLMGFALLASGVLIWLRMRQRPSLRRVARQLEAFMQPGQSRLLNALDLEEQDARGSPVLRARAVAAGASAAAALPTHLLRPARWLQWALLAAALAGLAGLGMAVLWPRAMAAVLPRLVQPLADLPPYTPLRFAVQVQPRPLPAGEPATLAFTIAAPVGEALPQQVAVVRQNDNAPPFRIVATPLPEESASVRRFTATLPGTGTPQRYHVITERGRSRWFTLTPDTTPLLRRAQVRIVAPAYLNLPDRIEAKPRTTDRPWNVTAWVGSTLHWTVESNVALNIASLENVAPPASPNADPNASNSFLITPLPGQPTAATGTMPLSPFIAEGPWTVQLLGDDGKQSAALPLVDLQVQMDQPPSVEIVGQPAAAVIPVDWPLPLTLRASDDAGLRDVVLKWIVGDQPAEALLFPATAPTPRDMELQTTLDTDARGLQAGDRVRYRATARDTRPGDSGDDKSPGGQITFTDWYEVTIVDEQTWQLQARQVVTLEQLAADWQATAEAVEALGAARQRLLAALDALSPPEVGTAAESVLKEATRKSHDFGLAAGALSSQLRDAADQPTLYDAEQTLREQADALARSLAAQAAAATELAEALEALAYQSGAADTAGLRASVTAAIDAFSQQNAPFDAQAAASRAQRSADWQSLAAATDPADPALQELATVSPQQAAASVAAQAEAKTSASESSAAAETVIGPHPLLDRLMSSTGSGDGRGSSAAESEDIGLAIDSLPPEVWATSSTSTPGAAPASDSPLWQTLPQHYRDAVAAYFQRLAEDAK